MAVVKLSCSDIVCLLNDVFSSQSNSVIFCLTSTIYMSKTTKTCLFMHLSRVLAVNENSELTNLPRDIPFFIFIHVSCNFFHILILQLLNRGHGILSLIHI